MPLTADDAFQLARNFREVAKQIGDTRTGKWDTLTPDQRQTLENEEWDLLSSSMSMRTKAVGIVLEEAKTSLAKIVRVTDQARKAIKTLENVRAAIGIASAVVTLAAAILSKDPQAIAKASQTLLGQVKEAIG
jgi:ABC-type dipeptide/oligopeptide/nickel transport system ATPase component